MLQREAPSPLVLDTLQYVQRRVGDAQVVSNKDRIRIPSHFADTAANERVKKLVRELQGGAKRRPVPLVFVMREATAGDADRRLAVKALGMRILQRYAPRGAHDAWDSDRFGE